MLTISSSKMAHMLRRKDPTHPLGHAGLNYAYDVVIIDGSHGVKEDPTHRLGHARLNYAYDVVFIDGSQAMVKKKESHPSVRSCKTKLCLRCRHHRWLPW
jgi:hypothetical protein